MDDSTTGFAVLTALVAVLALFVCLIYKCMSFILYLARSPREDRYTNRDNFEGDCVDAGAGTLDLHGHNVNSALTELQHFLNSKYNDGRRTATVITGKGLHSPGGIPVIKPAVQNYLKEYGYRYDDLGGFLKVYLY